MGLTAKDIRRALTLGIATAALLPASASALTFTVAEAGDPVPGACTDDATGTDDCTLREAVIAANANPGPDTVVMTADVTLAQPGAGEDAGLTGDLDVTGDQVNDLTIEMPQPTDPPTPPHALDAGTLDRALDVPVGGPDLTVDGIEIQGGLVSETHARGGGIRFSGGSPFSTLSLTGVTVASNRADAPAGIARGGGVWAGSTGTGVARVSILGSSEIAGNNAGGLAAAREGFGGGVAIEGPAGQQLNVSGSEVLNNAAGGVPAVSAGSGGAGGGVWASFPSGGGGLVSLAASNVNGNSAGFMSSTGASLGIAANNGGGISVQGGAPLSVVGGVMQSNTAGGGGHAGNAANSYGGAVAVGPGSSASLGSTLSGNQAGGNGAVGLALGGGIFSEGNLTLNGGGVIDNEAGGSGGSLGGQGLYLGGTATLDVTGTSFTGNGTDPQGNGGAISNNAAGNMTIAGATIAENEAASGAGIFRQGSGTDQVSNSEISDNTGAGVDSGAAYFASSGPNATFIGSTISGNEAQSNSNGGAFFLRNEVVLVNSTVTGNSTGEAGGGIYLDASGKLYSVLSTIGENTAGTQGGNIYAQDTAGDVSLIGNLIFGGTAPTGPNCFQSAPGVINSVGYNIEQGTDDCGLNGTADLPNTDPGVGPLGSFGGPTMTRRPSNVGPAVDHVPAAVCTASLGPDVDQRGRPRPSDADGDGVSDCDAGAVELQAPGLSAVRTNPVSGSDNNNPRILGSTDLAALVGVYTTADCSGVPLAAGTGSDLNGSGFAVTVPDNATRTFYVRAGVLDEGISPCVPVTYAEVTRPLDPGPIGLPPAPKPKCKKGKKLKKVKGKFKCVKKKKRKK